MPLRFGVGLRVDFPVEHSSQVLVPYYEGGWQLAVPVEDVLSGELRYVDDPVECINYDSGCVDVDSSVFM